MIISSHLLPTFQVEVVSIHISSVNGKSKISTGNTMQFWRIKICKMC